MAILPPVNAATGGTPNDPTRAFWERARLEADRYGPDPWIFVRELLQNARDAGADEVRFHVFDREGPDATVICQDNGEGMTFDHARRFLFALYASSKEGKKNQAGKFGVGFWSVLRFEPLGIIIRSRPREGEAWGVSIDGTLEQVVPVDPPAHVGTEVILRRARREGRDSRLEHRIYDAVWQSARYLSQRDNPLEPLGIAVNGRPANAPFELDAPSASFQRGPLRGVVGLGAAPRVELFSRGLRVRSAACLEDLLSSAGRHTSWMRVQFTELSGGLAPQALLESPALEVMLSRSDARETRGLRRLVRLAQRELERLMERQLAAARPMPWRSRALSWVQERLRALSRLSRADAAVVAAAALVAIGMIWRGSTASSDELAPAAPSASAPAQVAAASSPAPAARPPGRPYQDLGSRYRGPSVDGLAADEVEAIGLRYRPGDRPQHFAALTFSRLGPDGSPIQEAVPRPVASYAPAATCPPGRCLQLELPLRTPTRAVRVPVPTGHRVVGASVTMEGQQAPRLRASADGRPIVVLVSPGEGLLRYRTVLASDPNLAPVPNPPELPARLGRRARQLRLQPVARRVAVLLELVRRRVAYDDSPTTARQHREAVARRQGFINRTLAIGAGDCDVQNGLLTALLHAAGVPARLAVGYLGDRGSVLPWVHAWVEYFDEGGRWQILDASETSAGQARVARSGGPSLDDPVEAFAVADAASASAPAGAAAPTAAVLPAPVLPTAAGRAPGPVARPQPGVRPPPVESSGWSGALLGAALPLLLLLGGGYLFRARTRHAFKLDGVVDLGKLIQGVLQQPGAFGHIHAVFYRPIVPLADGRAVSLSRARELASRGRLFSTRLRPELARTALAAGAAVVDYVLEEGKTVADALGAIDLDQWSKMIAIAADEPLLDEVNRLLRSEGEDWMVRSGTEVKAGVAALDLRPLGARLPGVKGTRLVLIDNQAPWLDEARRYFESRPQAATFMVLDQLALRLNLPRRRRGQILGESARQAILESFAT